MRRSETHALSLVRCPGKEELMPGKRWTKAEKKSVRQQLANGTAVCRIVVENRTWVGIAYLLRVLRIHWSNRWTRAQARSLIRQVVKEHQKLPEIWVEN